jgi:hypothetical protein
MATLFTVGVLGYVGFVGWKVAKKLSNPAGTAVETGTGLWKWLQSKRQPK